MNRIAKLFSAALVASVVTVAAPSLSLACDVHDGQAKQEKKKDDKVAQADGNTDQSSNKKKNEQAPTDKQEDKGAAKSPSDTRTN